MRGQRPDIGFATTDELVALAASGDRDVVGIWASGGVTAATILPVLAPGVIPVEARPR